MSIPPTPPTEEDSRGLAVVVLGYRCAMSQACGGEPHYREGAFEALEAATPAGEAEALFGLFFGFVRCLLAVADRPLQWRPTFCGHLCRDEWLAATMVKASQRGDIAGLLGAAAELVGAEALGDALNATQSLGRALARRGLHLCPQASLMCGDFSAKRTLH